jgi:pyridinium-3,5-bisthiocarboxylic acid mononucleotide nickel chelatase
MLLAYFDCFSGISGDMTLAALIDLGLDQDYLREQLGTLKLDGYSLNIRRSKRRGISGIRFDVEVVADQPHRGYRDIKNLIEKSGIHETAKIRALEIFEVVADAEARVHGTTKEEVHFHEVGAVDSIIDIVGAAIGIHRLGIAEIICSPLPLSRGFVETAHGTIPTPAPATLEILEGVPVRGLECHIELVTPTGAAIARSLASGFGPYPSFIPLKTGYGLGKSDPQQFPNALRVTLGRAADRPLNRDQVSVVRCQVDDLDPRVLGDLMELLFSRGALDVTFSSVQMKKNRPGTLVSIVIPPTLVREISEILLTHTTTLGVRVSYVDRIVLERRSETVQSSVGPVRVKMIESLDGKTEKRPEFDDVQAIARRTGRPSREILLILDRELNQ